MIMRPRAKTGSKRHVWLRRQILGEGPEAPCICTLGVTGAQRGVTAIRGEGALFRQYHLLLSTTLSSGSPAAKQRQFSRSIASHFWR